jgi:hypothetical protein
MFTPYVESLFGIAAYPAGAIVWASGELVTLAVAGALLLSIVGLAVLRDRSAAAGLAERKLKQFGHDRCLPSAA